MYCDIRGHHGKKWNYEPSEHYMRRKPNEKIKEGQKSKGKGKGKGKTNTKIKYIC